MLAERLVREFEADVSVMLVELPGGTLTIGVTGRPEGSEVACRCWRCGTLLTVETVVADACPLGTRPVCEGCAA